MKNFKFIKISDINYNLDKHKTLSEDEIISLILNEDENISNFDPILQTSKIAKTAVEYWHGNIFWIREDLLIEDLLYIAIKQNAGCLKFVRDQYHSEELSKFAIEQDSSNYSYLIDEFKTDEIKFTVLSDNIKHINVMPDVYRYWKSLVRGTDIKKSIETSMGEFYKVLNLTDEEQSYFVKNYTEGQILWNIEVKGEYLSKYDQKFQTKKIVEAGVKAFASDFYAVRDDLITDDLIVIALERDGMILESLEPERITLQMAHAAVSNRPDSIKHVPMEIRSDYLIKRALKADYTTVKHCPNVEEYWKNHFKNPPLTFLIHTSLNRFDKYKDLNEEELNFLEKQLYINTFGLKIL